MKVEKKDNGALSYSSDGLASSEKPLYNKVTVPKGSDVVYLQLSDETKVWLNAESSIRYPVAFKENERKVEITGEAYFEVAKSKGKRFVVSKGNMSVQVLGTKFNVNTYENEADIKVTLLEGSVKVQQEQSQKIIKPGEQAVVNGAKINVVSDVDLHQVMAWKEGRFVFNNTNIQLIMHQMERWYDLGPTQFENEAVKQWEFNGEISRYSNASKVLELLEKTGAVKFTVEGKKIVVRPL
nr:FecR family protein [Niastella soli]